jgi:hypothetical protein
VSFQAKQHKCHAGRQGLRCHRGRDCAGDVQNWNLGRAAVYPRHRQLSKQSVCSTRCLVGPFQMETMEQGVFASRHRQGWLSQPWQRHRQLSQGSAQC